MIAPIKAPLRWTRAGLAETLAAAVERFPAIEPWFVRTGRAIARRSQAAGGLYWFTQEALMRRLKRSGHKYREVSIRGVPPMIVDVTDATGRHPFFYSSAYEKAVTDVIVTALKPGEVFLDIGANIGYFSTLAARLVGPEGRVIAFEPHEGARAALAEMAARNEVLDIVEIVPIALAERDADFTLYTTDDFTSYSTLEPERSPMRNVVAFRAGALVHGTTLDGWLAGRPDVARRVRCIKIDVEGTESRVVAGMAEALRAPGLTIVCETSTGSEADLALTRAGFQRHRIERDSLTYGNFLYVGPGRSGG